MKRKHKAKKTGVHSSTHTSEYVYGIHPVTELIKVRKRRPIAVFTTSAEPRCMAELRPKLAALSVPIKIVSKQELTQLCGNTDHQSIVACTSPYVYRSKPFDPDKHPFIVLLDGIQDVRNVGAIIRSAYCTGVNGIILPLKGTAPLNPTALKASAGLAERMHIMRSQTATVATQEAQQQGYQLLVAGFGGQSLEKVSPESPICLVIGSEGFGVHPNIAQKGTVITLAQQSPEVSYNASVAAGIILYTLTQKLNTNKKV